MVDQTLGTSSYCIWTPLPAVWSRGDAVGFKLSFSARRKHTSFSGQWKVFWFEFFNDTKQCSEQSLPLIPHPSRAFIFFNQPLRNSASPYPFLLQPLEDWDPGEQNCCPKACPQLSQEKVFGGWGGGRAGRLAASSPRGNSGKGEFPRGQPLRHEGPSR